MKKIIIYLFSIVFFLSYSTAYADWNDEDEETSYSYYEEEEEPNYNYYNDEDDSYSEYYPEDERVFVSQEELDIQDSIKYYNTGVNQMKLKAYDNALESFAKAITLNPKFIDAYYNIASIFSMKKNYDSAYNAYMKIVEINPKESDALLELAKISYNRKNYSTCMKFISYIPTNYEYYFLAKEINANALEMFNSQKNKFERSKVPAANTFKKVLIDKFNSPAGIAVDSEGTMYVACYSDNSVMKIGTDKKPSVLIKDFMLEGPVGLAIDQYDNIYVANFDADNIVKITKSGKTSVFMDNISKPYYLYIKDDILYVSEQGNDVVLKYDLKSKAQ